jgi:hypothetical protein
MLQPALAANLGNSVATSFCLHAAIANALVWNASASMWTAQ